MKTRNSFYTQLEFITNSDKLFWESGGIYIYWNDTWESVMLRAMYKHDLS